MTEKLLPCPFCGGEADIFEASEDSFCALCTGCGVETPYQISTEEAVAAWNLRSQPENKPCDDCSGIVYRQTNSGKIIPANQRCAAKITPPCYQPDGDGCAYQIYGDNDDEPINQCKACPLCYSDKVRHKQPENKPLTLDELREMEGEPLKHWVWIENIRYPGNSGYMRNHLDFSDGERFNCGWPGQGYSFKYKDYGKTWLAYRYKPEEETQ